MCNRYDTWNKNNKISIKYLCNTGMTIRWVVNVSLGVLISFLSVPVVLNLLSSTQVMNTSFDPLRIVNTYGAFGRYCIVGPSKVTWLGLWSRLQRAGGLRAGFSISLLLINGDKQ